MSARILAHSCHASPYESIRSATEIATLELCYPRYIHSEFMTHRHISRNARSSRAVPVSVLIKEVRQNPVVPNFRANVKGMQPGQPLPAALIEEARREWLLARMAAVNSAQRLADMEVHKQWANRLLEPFSRIHVVATASMFWWGSFLALRNHLAAQDEIQELARDIKAVLVESHPQAIEEDFWHTPYMGELCYSYHGLKAQRVSAARCARVSYKPFDQASADIGADLALAERLITSNHWSPFEHVCTPGETSGNLPGWTQLRHILERT